jgi:hypothetical protein
MVFAKAKTQHVCMMQTARAGQGSPGSLALWVAPKHEATTKAATGLQARRMDKLRAAAGICIPGSPRTAFLGWKQCESNEFSSGEEESFGSESRVNSRRVCNARRHSPRGFQYDGGMELTAWLL